MKKCELCKSTARMYCDSDEAILCWDCDARVHTANFLVAKHTRTLLCHVCQSPTPWTGSGPKLGPTVSICKSCPVNSTRNPIVEGDCDLEDGAVEYDIEDDDDEDQDDDRDGSDDDEEEEEEEGENQVVPLVTSSCSSEESSTRSCRRDALTVDNKTYPMFEKDSSNVRASRKR